MSPPKPPSEPADPLASLYRQLFDAMPVEMALFDPDSRFLYVNRSAIADQTMRHWLIGRTEEDYCAFRGIEPSLAVRRRAYRDRARDRRRAVSFEETMETATGTRHFLRTIVPIMRGDEVTHFAGFGLEITEQKRVEEAVRKSEAKYRSLFEQTHDVVYISTPEGQLLDMNQAGLDLLGFGSKEEIEAIDLARDLYSEPWERERLRQLLERQGFVKGFKVRLRTRRREELLIEVTATAIRDAQGKITTIMGVLRDVTASRRLEEQLRQSQKMEAVGRVARGLAHEFNNLLTAINGYSELLLFQLEEGDTKRGYVEQIRAAGHRAAALIGRLVTLSRPSEAAALVCDMNHVLEAQETLVRQVLGEDIDLEWRLASDLSHVSLDPGQIEQIVLNLALNARDAMPKGGRLSVETREVDLDPRAAEAIGAQPGRWVRLEVRDTGVGVAPDVRDRMFEPFFTTKEAAAGSGLGLSTVYGIVRQAGGHIDVESSPQQGTTFRIYIPAASEMALAATEAAGETVLVVEDEPAVRELISDLLLAEGYRVIAAVDGADALARVEDEPEPIDLLVTDVVMPGLSGPGLAARLQPRFPRLKTLYITGYGESHVSSHGVDPDREPILRKPFDPETLARMIRHLLDGHDPRG